MHPDTTSAAAIFRNPAGTKGKGRFAADLEDADRCVHCGMCLPQCPTYILNRAEGDSPRGRLTLMQGLARGQLQPDNPTLRNHLQGCLGCRSCEVVCPARVPFGALIDRTREILAGRSGWASRLRERLFGPIRTLALRRRGVRRMGALAARMARGLGIRHTLRRSTRLGRMLRHTAPSLVAAPLLPAPTSGRPVDVRLFTGCMDAFFTGPDVAAAIDLLHGLGLHVDAPVGQVCCGAIDQHLGRPVQATALLRENARAFSSEDTPIIVLDSGCEAQLREHADAGWRDHVTSLTGYLSQLPLEAFAWRENPIRIALHLPCTLRNVNHETAAITELFRRLPGIEVVAAVPPHNCCGAAGTAMLTQPEIADALGRETLEALQGHGADVIVSPNVGCSVHLRALQQGISGTPRLLSPARFLCERLAIPAP
jgi:glycolate oxidase iron-sulfur subunit